MTDQRTLIAGGVVGAALGIAVSFMYFTEAGRAWRQEIEQNLDSLTREAEKLLGAVDQVRTGVAELRSGQGWQRTA